MKIGDKFIRWYDDGTSLQVELFEILQLLEDGSMYVQALDSVNSPNLVSKIFININAYPYLAVSEHYTNINTVIRDYPEIFL